MRKLPLQTYVLCTAAAFFCVAAGFAVLSYVRTATPSHPPLSATRTVVFDGSSYQPAELVVLLGDTVTFENKGTADAWPASDPHPNHGIYPEFDPKAPVVPGSSWKFTFSRAGTFTFHDHLSSQIRGTVTVLEQNQTVAPPVDCTKPGENRTKCWLDEIQTVLQTKGLDAAFQRLADLYATQPEFAASCHDNAHRLGEFAYREFAAGHDIDLTAKTSYCGYGFYHGFMEKLLQQSGNIAEAKKFCAYVGNKLRVETTDAEGACYHGIGHGAVDGGDPRTWGDPIKMLAAGQDLCEKVAGDDRAHYGKLYRCITGTFNAVEILSADPKYQLGEFTKDAFSICPKQKQEYREGCYTNMIPAYMRLYGNDLHTVALKIEQITEHDPNYELRGPNISAVYHEWIRLHLSEPGYAAAAGVAECGTLSKQARPWCIQGLSGGHLKYGKPTEEYKAALSFCGSSLLTPDEQDSCYNHVLSRLRIFYTEEKSKTICLSVPGQYRKYCGYQSPGYDQ